MVCPASVLTYTLSVVANMCSSSEFECRSGEKCIPTDRQCDNLFDCFDFSDEDNCSMSKPQVDITLIYS